MSSARPAAASPLGPLELLERIDTLGALAEERFADGRELALALQNYLAETAQTSPLRRGVTRMRWRSRRIIAPCPIC